MSASTPSEPPSSQRPPQFTRLQTGIPGMDHLLQGGLLVGGTYLILGAPGAGKTILANQVCFHQSHAGRCALFVTLLAENHSRMFGNMDSMSFFDRSRISDSIHYVSGYNILEKEGLDGLMRMLASLVQRHSATLLVVDGVATAHDVSERIDFKKFVHTLNSVVGISCCTTLLLSSMHGGTDRPEYTMVDGILSVTAENKGMRIAREIEVTKFRGSPHLHGRHFLDITEHGLAVYPRIETAVGIGRDAPEIDSTLKTGTPSLDRVLEGGLPTASFTSLLGPVATGKTTIGMRFLRQSAENGLKGLYVNLYEHPNRLLPKLENMGISLREYIESGQIEILRWLPSDYLLDKLLYRLLDVIEEKQIKCIFVDGAGGLKQSGMLGSERLQDVMKAMSAELKYLGVTTLFTEETDSNKAETLSFDSAITDNVIETMHAQFRDRRMVVINVLKKRSGPMQPQYFELLLTDNGPEIGKQVILHRPEYPVVQYADGNPTEVPRKGRKPK